MLRISFLYILLSFIFTSCITNKDLDILQIKNTSKLKVFNNVNRLSDGDLIYVEIKSLTPTNYDFFNKEQQTSNNQLLSNPYVYGYLINDSGYVSLPVIGNIFLRGKSIDESVEIIKALADNYFSNPFVKVIQLNFNVTVLGEVNSPGVVNVIDPKMNILDVIGRVNGFTTLANRKKIKVIRFEDENPKVYYINLTNKNVTNSELFFVKSGDIISVEPMKKRFFVVNNLSSGLSILVSVLTMYILFNQSN